MSLEENSRSKGSSAARSSKRSSRVGRCEVCRRELAARSLTIVHDDTGDHELCATCEEVWSRQIMTYFAREFMAYCEANAFKAAA